MCFLRKLSSLILFLASIIGATAIASSCRFPVVHLFDCGPRNPLGGFSEPSCFVSLNQGEFACRQSQLVSRSTPLKAHRDRIGPLELYRSYYGFRLTRASWLQSATITPGDYAEAEALRSSYLIQTELHIPRWLLLIMLILYPLVFVARHFVYVPYMRRRRLCCVRCGYDLRGSPTNRCSECGKIQPMRPRTGEDRMDQRSAEKG